MLAKIQLLWSRFAACSVIAASPQTHVKDKHFTAGDSDLPWAYTYVYVDYFSSCLPPSLSPSFLSLSPSPSVHVLSPLFFTCFSHTVTLYTQYIYHYAHRHRYSHSLKIKHVCKHHIHTHTKTLQRASTHLHTHRLKVTLRSSHINTSLTIRGFTTVFTSQTIEASCRIAQLTAEPRRNHHAQLCITLSYHVNSHLRGTITDYHAQLAHTYTHKCIYM